MKLCSKTHQIPSSQKKLSGKHAPEPPSKRLATPRVDRKPLRGMQLALGKSCPWQILPLANPALGKSCPWQI